jgi:hypothetical protein
MLAFLSIFISLFLIILGVVAISIGIRTYIYLSTARMTTVGDIVHEHPVFILQGLAEGDIPVFFPAKPLYALACVTVIGFLPLSFGVLLFVRMVGIF